MDLVQDGKRNFLEENSLISETSQVWNVHTNKIDRINDVVDAKEPRMTAMKPPINEVRAETVTKVK